MHPSPSVADASGGDHRAGTVRHLIDRLGARTVWRDTSWAVIIMPIGVVTFTVVLTGAVLAAVLMPVFLLGLPVASMLFLVGGSIARYERRQITEWFGVVIPEPRSRAPGQSWLQQLRTDATSVGRWAELVHAIYRFPMGMITFTVSIATWVGLIVLLPLPLYGWALPENGMRIIGVSAASAGGIVFLSLVGLALAVTAPSIMAGLRMADVAVTRLLLGTGRQELSERIDVLESSRAGVVDAAAVERQRIERDLHDGAQQRLVSVALNLGMARQRYDDDPAAARALIDQSHAEAKLALVELRHLVRGIHPAVLADRGLDAALSGLAGQSPVPVTVDVDLPYRLPPAVEAVAYFVVSEALTNVAKHAPSAHANVLVRLVGTDATSPGRVNITVSDDGPGGATVRPGGGLAGLAGRVAGSDGSLSIDSPAGGPTRLAVELPCAS